jgi:hypothetical protein
VDDQASTMEDTPVTIAVLPNDTDPENGPLTVSLPSPTTAQGGTVSVNTNGTVLYTPAANYCGTDTFTYTITDASGQTDTATVVVLVSCVKDVPTAVATGGTFPYDGNGHAGTCTVTGAMGESLAGTLSYTPGGATSPVTVGSYTVNCAFTGNDDYEPVTATSNITITPRPAVVTAGTATKVYGTADPALSAVSTTGFLGADLGALVLNQSRATGETVGNYATTATATGGSLSNYSVVYVPAAFTITKAPLVVTTNNKTRVQGTPNPVLDGALTGVVAGDNITATYATTATVSSPAGTYPITPSLLDPNGRLGNYNVVSTPGTLTVTPSTQPCSTDGFTTYSQGGWGSKPSGNNPGMLLKNNFSAVYPDGYVKIGTPATKWLKFTSAYAIEKFLPQGGSSNVLNSSATNPTSSSAGNFAAQLLALQLAVDFSAAGVTKEGLGSLVMVSGPLAGKTVDEILELANKVIGGQTSALPSGLNISGLAGILESLIMNFHEGTVNQGLLGCGDGPAPCVAKSFTLNQNQSTGSTGNVRTFTTGGSSVKVMAFSRDKSNGNWAKAFGGAFGTAGLGVTDSSENGSGNTHTVDNNGRNNYLVFVFDQPVVATTAAIGYVSGDSDAEVWVGTIPGAYGSSLMLSDAILNGLGSPETSMGGSSARTFTFNSGGVAGNVVVIAAKTNESNDYFKLASLSTACAPPPPPTDPCDVDGDGGSHSNKSGKSGKWGKSNKSSSKSGKSDKDGGAGAPCDPPSDPCSAYGGTSDKSGKSTKSGKSWYSSKSSKSSKSCDGEHSDKSSKSNKWDKSTKSNHYEGDGDDHDKGKNGHKPGDGCSHDSVVKPSKPSSPSKSTPKKK